MSATRHYDYVPTETITRRGRRVGRPPVPKAQQLLHEVRAGMTQAEAEAFERWQNANNIDVDRAALRKILLDRLKADGFLL